MNKFQKNHHRQQSRLAAGAYIPAAECIGKEFAFGSHLYRVIQYHPERWTFTCELVNAFNQRIEKEETFVRHHCTPPQPREVAQQIPCRPTPLSTQWRATCVTSRRQEGVGGEERYFPNSNPIISDKTEVDDNMTQTDVTTEATTELTTIQPNTTLEAVAPTINTTFQNHLVTGDIKNQGEWHRCLVIARELRSKQLWGGVLPLHICGDVSAIHHHMTFHCQLPYMKLVGNQWYCYLNAANTPVTASSPTAEVAAAPSLSTGRAGVGLDPAHYIGQKFAWTTDGTTFNVTVQAWNAERKQFRLYEPRGGCWYREPAFVYEHCQPAAAPVVCEPLPTIEVDPRRFWNLVSLADKRQLIAEDVQATGVPQADPLLQCACCGQHVTIIGKQIWSPKMHRKDSIMVECRNEDCIAHRRTATTESHHQICEDAKREVAAKHEALKKEQILYAHERAQYWLATENRLRESGKGHSKSAQAAGRKAQYWLDQLNKLEGKSE